MEDKNNAEFKLETDNSGEMLQDGNTKWPKSSKISLLISLCISLVLIIVIIILAVYYNNKLSENSNKDSDSSQNNPEPNPQIIDSYNFFGQKYSNLTYDVGGKITNTFKSGGDNYNSSIGEINNGKDYEKNERNIYDLYIPQYALDRKSEVNGIILWLHGGAWISGYKDYMDTFCKMFSQQGYISATVGYTILTNEFKEFNIFKILDEITACIKAIKNELNERGFNVNNLKMGIGGYSAGSHLALLYSYLIKEFDIPLEFVINFVGPIGLYSKYFYKLKSKDEPFPNITEVSLMEKAIEEGKIIPIFQGGTLDMMNLFLGNKYTNEEIRGMYYENGTIKEDDENYKNLINVVKNSFITEIEDKHLLPTICIYGGIDEVVGVTPYAYLKEKADNDGRHLDFIYSITEGHMLAFPTTPEGSMRLREAISLSMRYLKEYFGY